MNSLIGAAALVNATIGRYNILDEIERGATGILYKGDDPLLERPVAIKILPPALMSDPDAKERLFREAQAAARLNHPNIQRIYDIAENEGIYFIVSEFVDGQSFDKILHPQKAFGLQEALTIFMPVCDALDYAHQHNVIHRNVQPANVLVSKTPDGVKMAGFGLAWFEAEQALAETSEAAGTFSYFSPEQARGEKVDARSDIYSLGVMFYEALTGRLPFLAENPADLIQAQLSTAPEPPSGLNQAVSSKISDFILKAIQIEPEARYQSMKELIDALADAADGEVKKSEISPEEAAEHNTLGSAYYKQGKLDLAVLEWEKAAALDPYNALTHNNLGTAYDGLKMLERAQQEYQKAVDLNPNNFIAHYNLGSAFYRLNNLDACIREYKTVIALNSKFATAYHNLGNSYFKQGNLDAAVAEWQKALANNPQLAEAIFNLGNAFWKRGRQDEAVEYWKRTLEADPAFGLAAYNLGAALYKEGKTEEAQTQWNKALEINAEFPEVHYNIGVVAYEKQDMDGAIQAFEKAVQQKSDYWQALYNVANAYYQKGNLDMAEVFWRRTVLYKNNYWAAHWNLGCLYAFDLNRQIDAVQSWQTVLTLKPDHWPAHFNIGEVYFKEGELELAQAEWERTIQINPEYWPAYHNLGSVAYKRGDLAQAIQWWAKALAYLVFVWK